jgi:hypothetical protein
MQCVAFIDKWRYVSGADEKVSFLLKAIDDAKDDLLTSNVDGKVMRVFDAPKTFIESLAALTGHEELESQAVSAALRSK